MSAAAAGAAAAAAAEARRRMEREEEAMSGYTQADLAGAWEFKILRSATNAFRRPEVMRAALEEEARAGWTLVEKFDNARLRLERPASARANDDKLGFDPYRTAYGTSDRAIALIIVCSVAGVIGALVLVAVIAAHAR